MIRVILIHWNSREAAERIAFMQAAGFEAVHEEFRGPETLKRMRQSPPDAFVIDLGRLPSHGREVALALRQAKPTRMVPLVFVDGEPEKVERIRALLPDATFTAWSRLRTGLRRAVKHPPAQPVVPAGTMAGYSGTPLPKKLGIKPGTRVALVSAPGDFQKTLGELPEGAELLAGLKGKVNLTIWFVRSSSALRSRVSEMARRIGDSPIWIAWPKKGSALESDISERAVREAGLSNNLVDYKICAVDATWSGLLFTRRKH